MRLRERESKEAKEERDSVCEKLTALLAFRLIQMKMDELLNVVIVAAFVVAAASSASNGMSKTTAVSKPQPIPLLYSSV